MEYEYEIRNLMYELVKEDGWAMTDALVKAMKDVERRRRWFSRTHVAVDARQWAKPNKGRRKRVLQGKEALREG